MTSVAMFAVTRPPSPGPTRTPGALADHGAGFWGIAVLLIGLLLLSTWRLRRRATEPEN